MTCFGQLEQDMINAVVHLGFLQLLDVGMKAVLGGNGPNLAASIADPTINSARVPMTRPRSTVLVTTTGRL